VRHVLACTPLRKTAVKVSRLESLACVAIDAALSCKSYHVADAAASAVLSILHDLGVDVVFAGRLETHVTPLINTVQHSLCSAAHVLLDAGADVDASTLEGQFWPLQIAASTGSDDTMESLLAHGASLRRRNCLGRTIVHEVAGVLWAERSRASEAFSCRWLRSILAEEPGLLDEPDSTGKTPLMLAALEGAASVVTELLARGASLRKADVEGSTALAFGCQSSSLPVVRLLIAAGAASAAVLPPRSRQARSVASTAVCAAVPAAHGCGSCAGHCGGVGAGNCADGLKILRAVLAAGVRESASFPHGQPLCSTLVHLVAGSVLSEGHALTIMKTLRAAGVNVLSTEAGDDFPVLHVAATSAFHVPDIVRWLASDPGANLNERDRLGYTPLLRACARRAWASAHALLDCGARADVLGGEGGYVWPLDMAVERADRDFDAALVKRLLAADPDSVVRRARDGSTPVHHAATASLPCLQLLLDSGMPRVREAINSVAEGGRGTPLHLAIRHSRWACAQALLAAGARVDIRGAVKGEAMTVAQWARGLTTRVAPALTQAIAARAREHEAEAARAGAGAAATEGCKAESAPHRGLVGSAAAPACATLADVASSAGSAAVAVGRREQSGIGAAALTTHADGMVAAKVAVERDGAAVTGVAAAAAAAAYTNALEVSEE
jgi:ankyrin repeat protein